MASKESKIDTKLDYLENTKLLIKQAMANKGIEVTDNTTFRTYADLINNLIIGTDQSDATATATDIVAGKIAYNDNIKVVGSLIEYATLSSEALEVVDDTSNSKFIAKIQTDNRLLLGENAEINVEIPYSDLTDYEEALEQVDDILGINND